MSMRSFFLLIGLMLTGTQAQADRLIRDSWYITTVHKKPFQYYNERIDLIKDHVRVQNKVWKQEEGYINEEQDGAVALNNPALEPIFFNFHSTYRTQETLIDGTVQDHKLLVVHVRRGDKELPVVRRGLAKGVIFSEHFTIWLEQELPKLKPNQPLSFMTVLEDNIDDSFAPIPGQVFAEKSDEFSKKTGTQKISVKYHGVETFWWVEKSGAYIRIEIPSQEIVTERVPKERALDFLK